MASHVGFAATRDMAWATESTSQIRSAPDANANAAVVNARTTSTATAGPRIRLISHVAKYRASAPDPVTTAVSCIATPTSAPASAPTRPP